MSIRQLTLGIWIVAIAGCAIATINMGVRVTFGLFQSDILRDLPITPSDFGFALAIQNLIWGATTPVFGALADKYGSMKMIVLGTLLYALGLWVMGSADDLFDFNLGAGILIGMGMGGTGFGVVFGAVGRRVQEQHRSLALGIASTGTSFGQVLMAPIGQVLIEAHGWSGAIFALSLITLIMVPLAYLMTRGPLVVERNTGITADGVARADQKMGAALSEAYGHYGYILLTLGFFVCGFQVAFMTVHLPKYLQTLGMDLRVAALSLLLVGVFNMVGTFGCGLLGGKFAKKWILCWLYFMRSVCIIAMLLAPKTEINLLIFAASIGLFWLGTVPLTSGLIAHMFGVRYLSTLFGIVFFSHQIGSFLGVWLGGYLFEATGSYDWVWYIAIILGFAAAAIHLPIPEERPRPVPA